jgi:hypothetical protein
MMICLTPSAFAKTAHRVRSRWSPMRGIAVLVSVALVATWLGANVATASVAPSAPSTVSVSTAKRAATLPWVSNAGQWDARAAFRAQNFAGATWVTHDGALVHQFNAPVTTLDVVGDDSKRTSRLKSSAANADWVLTERFVGGNVRSIIGAKPQITQVSYFVASRPDKQGNTSTFESVSLGEVYPGIAIELRAAKSNVEKLYTVSPGANPAHIRMHMDGARDLAILADGRLQAMTDHGPVAFTAPIAFQESDAGERTLVAVSYVLDPKTNQYGYSVADYDRTRALTIDPLLASTYLGGSDSDNATAVAVHPGSGLVYVAGYTRSDNFPGTSGGALPTNTGNFSAFVARLSPDLSILYSATYFGGSAGTITVANSIVINPNSGNVYIAGDTRSSTLPGTAGSPQTAYGGGTISGNGDAFVAVFDASLGTLIRSSFHGGASDDGAQAMAYHPTTQDIYIGGNTTGVNNLPGVSGGAQAASGVGRPDCYVTRFNALLTQRLQSSYLSGSSGTVCDVNALAVHPISGAVLAAGTTNHPGLPGAASGAYTTISGSQTVAFVTRLNADLTAISASTYEPVTGDAGRGLALAIHPTTGDVYLGGTGSIGFTTGSAQPSGGSGFISRFSAGLATRYPATRVGPTSFNAVVRALAYNASNGDIVAAGNVAGGPWTAASNGVQTTYGGGDSDGFALRVNAGLTAFSSTTFLGTAGSDEALGVAVSPLTGNVFVVGFARGAGLPGASVGVQPTISSDNWDGFVTAFTPDMSAFGQTPSAFTFRPRLNVIINTTHSDGPVQISGLTAFAPVSIGGAQGNVCISSTATCTCNLSPGGVWGPSGMINNGQYLCVRATAAAAGNTFAEASIGVGGYLTKFLTYTGQLFNCSMDVDGDGEYRATTDGVIIARAMMGMTGTAVTNGVMGHNPPRNTWALLRTHFNNHCGMNLAQ